MGAEREDIPTWPQWKSRRRTDGYLGLSLRRRTGDKDVDVEGGVGDGRGSVGDGVTGVSFGEGAGIDNVGFELSSFIGGVMSSGVLADDIFVVGLENGNVFSWKMMSLLVKNW